MIFFKKKNNKTTNQTIKIIIYSKEDCELCQPFIHVFLQVSQTKKWHGKIDLNIIDIQSDNQLVQSYQEKIPLAFINNKLAFKFFVTKNELLKKLEHVKTE